MVKVRDVINHLTAAVSPIHNTVDTLKSGNKEDEVRGIATAFMPSLEVIQQAISRGINLLIAHEAPFYHHHDRTDPLEDDPVYTTKKSLIESSGIAIFRLHDYMHRQDPDTIVTGLIRDLDWEAYIEAPPTQAIMPFTVSQVVIPTMTANDIAEYLKEKLQIPFVRMVGDAGMQCTRVGFLPGYRGSSDLVIPYFRNADLDLIIAGEGPEWEAPEYIRDAMSLGFNKALIILGHENSEAPGMKELAESLRRNFSGIPVEFITRKQIFQLI